MVNTFDKLTVHTLTNEVWFLCVVQFFVELCKLPAGHESVLCSPQLQYRIHMTLVLQILFFGSHSRISVAISFVWPKLASNSVFVSPLGSKSGVA